MKNRLPGKSPISLIFLVVAMVAGGGCGQGSIKVSAADKKAFEGASPEAKQTWERILAEDKSNDYLSTLNLLNSLEQMPLSDAQKQALAKEREAFNQRIWDAAQKNDPAAVKAVQESQKSRRRTVSADGK